MQNALAEPKGLDIKDFYMTLPTFHRDFSPTKIF
jgi:hypothetical protein